MKKIFIAFILGVIFSFFLDIIYTAIPFEINKLVLYPLVALLILFFYKRIK